MPSLANWTNLIMTSRCRVPDFMSFRLRQRNILTVQCSSKGTICNLHTCMMRCWSIVCYVCDWICKYAAKYIIFSLFLWRESLKEFDDLQSVNWKKTSLLIEQIPEIWLPKLELQLYGCSSKWPSEKTTWSHENADIVMEWNEMNKKYWKRQKQPNPESNESFPAQFWLRPEFYF